MSKRINILTACYTLFLVMLFGSATFSGILSEAVYYLAFIIPIAIALISCRGEESDPKKYLTIDADGIRLSWPVVFPTISHTLRDIARHFECAGADTAGGAEDDDAFSLHTPTILRQIR